ncbi:hypothetical protein NQ318_013114 [Aromia moschata]|uniref:Uncharacterized protein n=1 Tax=Aromia moschata TaxID=1265417 RepID=A0AAV8XAL4_9CUCU|nr:hypothetical protein NQ318_013114 [Aromia moschata]
MTSTFLGSDEAIPRNYLARPHQHDGKGRSAPGGVQPGVLPLVLPQFNSLQLTAHHQSADISHPAVVENAIAESQLPPELLNPFYKNPAIASALARESWPTNKESIVTHRETEEDTPPGDIQDHLEVAAYKEIDVMARLHRMHFANERLNI